MQKPELKTGGARPGAGRPKIEDPAKNTTVRLTTEQRETLEKVGGPDFIRGILDLLKGLIK
jgi:hypothetical protein